MSDPYWNDPYWDFVCFQLFLEEKNCPSPFNVVEMIQAVLCSVIARWCGKEITSKPIEDFDGLMA